MSASLHSFSLLHLIGDQVLYFTAFEQGEVLQSDAKCILHTSSTFLRDVNFILEFDCCSILWVPTSPSDHWLWQSIWCLCTWPSSFTNCHSLWGTNFLVIFEWNPFHSQPPFSLQWLLIISTTIYSSFSVQNAMLLFCLSMIQQYIFSLSSHPFLVFRSFYDAYSLWYPPRSLTHHFSNKLLHRSNHLF